MTFKDNDRDLDAPEIREFHLAKFQETKRKSYIHFLCKFEKESDIQSVRWWIFINGPRDMNKVWWSHALSPLKIPFVWKSYMRREHNPIPDLMTIDAGFFNAMDIFNRAREVQFVAFETLITILESHGIDASDLKQQKGNILNINVSGGQTSFGSVVQGAVNKFAVSGEGHAK